MQTWKINYLNPQGEKDFNIEMGFSPGVLEDDFKEDFGNAYTFLSIEEVKVK